MNDIIEEKGVIKLPESGKTAKISRGALQAIGGAIPFAGGILSALCHDRFAFKN